MEPTAQIVAAFLFGLAFVITLIVLAIKFSKPTPFQYYVFRVVLALAAAGVGAVIPGFLDVNMNPSAVFLLRAGGAFALFVLVYFGNPARLVVPPEDQSQDKNGPSVLPSRSSATISLSELTDQLRDAQQKANRALQHEEYKEAKEILLKAETALKQAPGPAYEDLYFLCIKGFLYKDLAQIYSREGERILADGYLDQAEETFKRLLKLDPADANAHHGLGDVYLIRGDRKHAIEKIRKALELDPSLEPAREHLRELEEEDRS